MHKWVSGAVGAAIGGFALTSVAMAQSAVATTDLNMRAGPGPQFPIVGSIPANGAVTVHGCIKGGSWCDVTAGNDRGWSYAAYLQNLGDQPVVAFDMDPYWEEHYRNRPFFARRAELRPDPAGPAAGALGGAVIGAIVGGPVGAAVGAAAGAVAVGAVTPPREVDTFVAAQNDDPVLLDGEVVVGGRIPDAVVLHPVPDYEYSYAMINGQRVLVDPATHTIVYVYR